MSNAFDEWITTFARHDVPRGGRHHVSWAQLRAALSVPLEGQSKKDELPGFCLATFAGDYRSSHNVEFAYALGLDVDGDVTLDQATAHWHDRATLLYTTFSHRADVHRFRVLVRLSRPVTRAEYERCHEFERRRASAAGISLAGADQAKDASRFWYVPARPPSGLYEMRETDGAPLDVDAVLVHVPAHTMHQFDYESRLLDYRASRTTTNTDGSIQLGVLCAGIGSLQVGERHTGLYMAACRAGELIALGEVFQADLPSVSASDAEQALTRAVEAANWDADETRTVQDGLARGYSEGSVLAQLAQLPQTDLGNARRFVELFGDAVRYCTPKKKWLIWTGRRWEWDERDYAVELAKRTVRHIRNEAKILPLNSEPRKRLLAHAKTSESAERINALMRLARSDSHIAVLPADLDREPLLFNCVNGTVDLASGKLRPHRPDDLITMISPVAFNENVAPGIWADTLAKIVGDDLDLARYLQKQAGYALTGLNEVKEFWFAYGPPNAMKSTYLAALAAVFGDYGAAVDCQTWLRKRFPQENRGDLVRLNRKRLAYSVEFPGVAAFDEKLIKAWTGNDDQTAADKYEKHISFQPVAKLWFAANDAPLVGDNDEGMWDRCRRVPFVRALAGTEINAKAGRELRDPAVGGVEILAWAVAGYQLYVAEGLDAPESVKQSTQEYRVEVNLVARFLSDCCASDPTAEIKKSDLRDAFDQWCRDHGEKIHLSPTAFNGRIRSAGYAEKKNSTGYWVGVRLLRVEQRQDLQSASAEVRSKHSLHQILKDAAEKSVAPRTGLRTQIPPHAAAAHWARRPPAEQGAMLQLAQAIQTAGEVRLPQVVTLLPGSSPESVRYLARELHFGGVPAADGNFWWLELDTLGKCRFARK